MLFTRSPQSFTHQNEVRLVKSGNNFFDLLEQLIDQAREHIHLQTYIFTEDETGTRIANALSRAALRNVQVNLLVDGYASQDLSNSLITKMTDAGVRFQWFSSFLKSKYFYLGRRLHHKVFVADGEQGLVSGINISNNYNDTLESPAWLDYAIYVRGEAAQELKVVCDRRNAKKRILFKRLKKSPPVPKKKLVVKESTWVGVRVNDWVIFKKGITASYLQMLRNAKSHIIIMSPYFIPGSQFMKALIRAANRGVKIQLILAGVSDVRIAKHAERYIYSRLFKKNIAIYEYQKKVLHGKISVCDHEWVTVGSYNINNISAYASIELNLEIKDSRFTSIISDELNGVIENDCSLITKGYYNSRTNNFTRILQYTSYTTFRLLFYLFTFYFKQHRV